MPALKLLIVYSRIEQTSNYIEDNESQVSLSEMEEINVKREKARINSSISGWNWRYQQVLMA